MEPNLDRFSYRNSVRNVLLRASDNLDVVQLFEHGGATYEVVVALDTNHRRVRVSIREGVCLNALAICRDCFGASSEGNDRRAVSPEGTILDISDAWNCALTASKIRPIASTKLSRAPKESAENTVLSFGARPNECYSGPTPTAEKEAIEFDYSQSEKPKETFRPKLIVVRPQQPSSRAGQWRELVAKPSPNKKAWKAVGAFYCTLTACALALPALWTLGQAQESLVKATGLNPGFCWLILGAMSGGTLLSLRLFYKVGGRPVEAVGCSLTACALALPPLWALGLFPRDIRGFCFWFFILAMIGGGLVTFLLTYAKRLDAQDAQTMLRRDNRFPLLLLRAFDEDWLPPVTTTQSSFAPIFTKSISFEQILISQFSRCGPVIAIGRPGETVPPLGAARFWVSDSLWRKVIKELLQESQLVVMVMGQIHQRAGLKWEVETIFGECDLRKVVLVMPPITEEDAKSRWEEYRTFLGDRLPPYQSGEIAATFDTSGNCQVAYLVVRKQVFSNNFTYQRDESSYKHSIVCECLH